MRRLVILAALAVAGCAQGPAGGGADWPFGNATASNALVQSGALGAAESLSARFATTVPATITFAYDSAALDAGAQAALAAQAGFIRAFPEVRFSVTGHADEPGSAAYNRDLGLRRARAAVALLVAQGVDASRLDALVSQGESAPVVATSAPERRNRRVVTTVAGFVAGHPSVLDGRYAAVIAREYVASATAPSGFGEGGGEGGGEGAGAAAPE